MSNPSPPRGRGTLDARLKAASRSILPRGGSSSSAAAAAAATPPVASAAAAAATPAAPPPSSGKAPQPQPAEPTLPGVAAASRGAGPSSAARESPTAGRSIAKPRSGSCGSGDTKARRGTFGFSKRAPANKPPPPEDDRQSILTDDDEEEQAPARLPTPVRGRLAAAVPPPGGDVLPGKLVLNILSGVGLLPGEPYAKVIIKAADTTHGKKTEHLRREGGPFADVEWNASFQFSRIWSESTEVVVIVKNFHAFKPNDYLGQIAFRLEDFQLPTSGDLVAREMELQPVFEGGRRQTLQPQGKLKLEVAWCSDGIDEAEYKELAAQKARRQRKKSRFVSTLRQGPDELGDDDSGNDEVGGGTVDAAGEAADAEARKAHEEYVQKRVDDPMKPGEYRLQVHVIEARDLVGRDMSGLSDPAVFVKAFGKQMRTSTRDKQASTVWDEHLFFESDSLTLDELNRSVVEVRVYDMDTLTRNDLIGQYSIDLPHIYYEKDHELHRRWVTLSAPMWAREGIGLQLNLGRSFKLAVVDEARGGVQGYVKLSMTLLGPDDKPAVHDEDEDEDEGNKCALLMPPSLKREVLYLVVGVLRAEQLPDMDTTLTGGRTTAGLDAYVHLRFNGYSAKTAVVKSKSPHWMHEFWIPVLVPSVGQLLTLSVMDRDLGKNDDLVDALTVSFDSLLSGELPSLGWWHLYGVSKSVEELQQTSVVGAAVQGLLDEHERVLTNENRFASEWRGKVLLQLSVKKREQVSAGLMRSFRGKRGGDGNLPEKLMSRRLERRVEEQSKVPYELQAAVVLGSDLGGLKQLQTALDRLGKAVKKVGDQIASSLSASDAEDERGPDDEVFVEVVVEAHAYRTRAVQLVDGQGDFVTRQGRRADSSDEEAADVGTRRQPRGGADQPGVLHKLNPVAKLAMAEDPKQLADVVVYLCSRRDSHRLAFVRLRAQELLDAPRAFKPRWLTLQPTAPQQWAQGQPPPSLLIHLSLLRLDAEDVGRPSPNWPPAEMPRQLIYSPYEVRLHLYQGKDMPPMDDNGLLDPYVVAVVNGQRLSLPTKRGSKRSSVESETVNPQWYETLSAQVWLPDLAYAPPLMLEVWDLDTFDAADFVGCVRMPMDRVRVGEAFPRPGATGGDGAAKPKRKLTMDEKLRAQAAERVQKAARAKAAAAAAAIGSSPSPFEAQRAFITTAEATGGASSSAAAAAAAPSAAAGPSGRERAQPAGISPKWHPLTERVPTTELGRGAFRFAAWAHARHRARPELGSVLVQLELFKLTSAEPQLLEGEAVRGELHFPQLAPSDVPLPSLRPETRMASLHIAVLGLQNVVAGGAPSTRPRFDRVVAAASGPRKPYVELDVGGRRWAERAPDGYEEIGDLQRGSTTPSCTPSASNPLYAETLTLQAPLPIDPIFLPALRVRVKDSLFGGLREPLLGATNIKLARYLPKDLFLPGGSEGPDSEGSRTSALENIREHLPFNGRKTETERKSVDDGHHESLQELTFDARNFFGEEKEGGGASVVEGTLVAPQQQQGGVVVGGKLMRRGPELLKSLRNTMAKQVRKAAEGASGVLTSIGAENEDILSQVALMDEAAAQLAGALDEADEELLESELVRYEQELKVALTKMARLKRELAHIEHEMGRGCRSLCGCFYVFCCWCIDRKQIALRNRFTQLQLERVTFTGKVREIGAEHRALGHAYDTLVRETPYMNGRRVLKAELEEELDDMPFKHFEVISGQGKKITKVATLNALLRVTPYGAPLPPADAELFAKLTTPQEYVVRVYVLRGVNLTPRDKSWAAGVKTMIGGGSASRMGADRFVPRMGTESYSDPYLRVTLGNNELGSRDAHLTDVLDAPFYRVFEIPKVRLPDDNRLIIECWDWDWDGDELIGRTEIALMDRTSSPTWAETMQSRPPLERRSLYSPLSRRPQGHLEMWVDILTPEAAAEHPEPIDIAPPQPTEWELRVICWQGQLYQEYLEDADHSGLVDMYGAFKFGNGSNWQHTETHARALAGQGSFNWRFKWPVTLDPSIKSEDARLGLQMWDLDVLSPNDYLGEAQLDLHKWFRRCSRRKQPRPAYCAPSDLGLKHAAPDSGIKPRGLFSWEQHKEQEVDPVAEHNRVWVPLHREGNSEPIGQMMISIELVPAARLHHGMLPAGEGRDEPNANPHLPTPIGRVSDDPIYGWLYRLLGPKYMRWLAYTLLFVFLGYLFFTFCLSFLGEFVSMSILKGVGYGRAVELTSQASGAAALTSGATAAATASVAAAAAVHAGEALRSVPEPQQLVNSSADARLSHAPVWAAHALPEQHLNTSVVADLATATVVNVSGPSVAAVVNGSLQAGAARTGGASSPASARAAVGQSARSSELARRPGTGRKAKRRDRPASSRAVLSPPNALNDTHRSIT